MILRQCLLRRGYQSRIAERIAGIKSTDDKSIRRRKAVANSVFRTPRRWLSTEVENQREDVHSDQSQRLQNYTSGQSQPDEDEMSPTRAAADEYREFKRIQALQSGIGATQTPRYQPHVLVNHPPSPDDVTLELLLASQSHLGHATSLWNPANSQYIFGIRDGIHIISLDVTAAYLRRAARIVEAIAAKGGLILFVGTRPGHDRCVVKAAELAGACHLFERWIPGSITNGQQILGRCQLIVVDEFDKEVPGFEDQLIERATLKPDLVVCLNPLENYVMLHECALNNIPTIGVIDTDANPTWVTYPIPANDDSIRCMTVIAGVLGRAGEKGRLRRLALAAEKKYTFSPCKTLQMPGHLKAAKKVYPPVLKLGGSIQELEEQDRGITYDYRLDEPEVVNVETSQKVDASEDSPWGANVEVDNNEREIDANEQFDMDESEADTPQSDDYTRPWEYFNAEAAKSGMSVEEVIKEFGDEDLNRWVEAAIEQGRSLKEAVERWESELPEPEEETESE